MTSVIATITRNQNALHYWAPIAYTRLVIYLAVGILKTTFRHVLRRTPKGQSLLEGYMVQILKLTMGAKVINIQQARKTMDALNAVVHLRTGTFTTNSRGHWAKKVKGQGWEGFWIPFKDQLKSGKKEVEKKEWSAADIGAGCDIVMFAIHGGGMVVGDALMFLSCYRSWMKLMQKKHNLKIGILSVEYSLAPETPWPGALNECVAAYRHLVEHQGVDPRRVVMCGDSAGANLCLTTALRLRDDYPHVPLPAGQVLFSPWVMCPKPMVYTDDDYISEDCELFLQAYAQRNIKILNHPHASPIQAKSLAGMPRMLIFVGGVETLRTSIEEFVAKARLHGVQIQLEIKEGKSHDYPLIEEISGRKVVAEAEAILAAFVAQVRDRYIGLE